jgi:ABC-type transport system involved in multi-copper enzyme maturation permease subunit
MWHGAWAVFRFEVRRTMTVSRIGVWVMLILFPVFIVSVLKFHEKEIEKNILQELESPRERYQRERRQDRNREESDGAASRAGADADAAATDAAATGMGEEEMEREAEKKPPSLLARKWGFVFFGLIPEVITLFGLLLWVPALVHAELEGRTWVYLAVRPRGRVSVLLGKFLAAIVWTVLAGWISTTICILVARPENALRLWGTMVGLVALAGLTYGAIYSLLGVWLHRRAMVVAVAYTLSFELLVSIIPAVINKFTVQYRLRNLLVTWMDWWEIIPDEVTAVLMGTEPAWLHLLILAAVIIAVLIIALQLIQRKEYVTVSDA